MTSAKSKPSPPVESSSRSKKWLAYVAAGAATTATMTATTDDVCADIVVNNPNASLLPGDVTPGEPLAPAYGGTVISRARFSTNLGGNGLLAFSARHPGSMFGILVGQAREGARFFGYRYLDRFTSSLGSVDVNVFQFPANAALGARFSTIQTRSQELSASFPDPVSGTAGDELSRFVNPQFLPSRTFQQFGQTYLATSPTAQDAFVAFTFDDVDGEQQYGFVRLNQVTPGLIGATAAGGQQIGLNGFVVEQVAYTTEGQADLDRGFAVGVVPAAVPEPGSMAVLALGAVGLAAWRRKRHQKSEVDTHSVA